MDTVATNTPAPAPFGSVERYAEIIRESGADRATTYAVATALVGSILDSRIDTAAEKVKLIRNALAAAEQIRAELAAR